PNFTTAVVLTAGRGWPAWTPSACLVLALAVVVVAITCGASCASSLALRIPRQVIKTGDSSVEVLLPQSGGCLELDASGWSRVPLIDAVGGPPYRNFANEGGAWVTSRRGPGRLVGEPGHELGGSVERRHGLGSEELFGHDMEPVGVALDRLVEPRRRVLKLTQQGGGGDG